MIKFRHAKYYYIIRHYYVEKNCAMKLKTFGTQCWVYEKLLPELYDSLAWSTKCILIILKHGIFYM